MSTTTLAGAVDLDVKGLVQLNGFHAFFDADTAQLRNGSLYDSYHTNGYLHLAKLGLAGRINDDWSFVVTPLDYRYVRAFYSRQEATAAEEASLSYTGLNPVHLKIGIFRPGYGFENMTADENLAFSGRSTVAQLLSSQPGFGVEASGRMEGFTYAVSAHAPTTDSDQTVLLLRQSDTRTAPILGFNARVTYGTQWAEQGVLAHVGASLASVASVRKLGWDIAEAQVDIFTPLPIWNLHPSIITTPPVSFITDGRQPGVFFPSLSFSKRFSVMGAEVAAQKGPLSAHAEFHYAAPKLLSDDIPGPSAPALKVHGFSLEAGYVITGETRTYCEYAGVFTNVVPHSEAGAWEIVARLDQIKLEAFSSKVQKTAYAAGVNYHANSYAAVKLNYALDCIKGKGIKDTKLHAISLGTQFSF